MEVGAREALGGPSSEAVWSSPTSRQTQTAATKRTERTAQRTIQTKTRINLPTRKHLTKESSPTRKGSWATRSRLRTTTPRSTLRIAARQGRTTCQGRTTRMRLSAR